ncbi:2OG-Fe(II) oxygenase [Elstera sp.]|uniref:2OG-Fe(II) oxygenase n=1 Tax=Elstera sp. TaxID=1916664 RepID=UPI0037C0D6E5
MTVAPASHRLPPSLVERMTQPAVLVQFLAGLEARLTPTDRIGLHRRASLLRGLGRGAEAGEAYRALLASDPHDLGAQAGAAIFAGAPLPEGAQGPTPFVQLADVLSADQQARLWQSLTDDSASLAPAGVYTGGTQPRVDGETRVAQLLERADSVRAWFLPWLEEVIARANILPRLGLAPFAVGKRELQVTGHSDGGFFSVHSDASANPAAPSWARHLTFIYYFHRLPRRFSGGDLLLFDPPGGGDLSFTRIDPTHNSLVLFQSRQMHTVTQIHSAATDPLDGRWTVNGWLHRAKTPLTPERHQDLKEG